VHGEQARAERPRVLVALPVYNAGAYLRPALDSVLGQTLTSLGVLVVDDGSTDGSLEVAGAVARTDPRVVVQALPHGGLARALNHCLRHAADEGITFFARMDADDLSAPERLAKQVALLERDQTLAAVGCNCAWIAPDGRNIGRSTVPLAPAAVAREVAAGYRGVIHGCALFRTAALLAVGGYRETFKLAEDADLFLRLSERFRLANVADTLYSIRLHDTSMSVNGARSNTLYAMYAIDCHERRRRGRPERSFEEFSSQLTVRHKLERWRHLTMLGLWRDAMTGRANRGVAIALAAALDPLRALARVRRKVEARFVKRAE
jgi:glycosyltransferase involved in cell wall biosynthesis